MKRAEIVQTVINDWYEHLEMMTGREWQTIAHILAAKLEKQIEETEYYRKVANVSHTARH